MDISNKIFFQYTMKQLKPEYHSEINIRKNGDTPISEAPQVQEGEISVANVGSTLSDEAIESIINNSAKTVPYNPIIELSTTYSSFTPAEISKIKRMIYNLHNEGGGDEPQPTTDKKTFIGKQYDNFCDAESMFTYIEKVSNGEITKSTGITKAQLIKLTQNELAEDNNYDFFGSLNRIFDNQNFNKNKDDVLSFAEINDFIGAELGEDYLEYLNKVNDYANEVQNYYSGLSNQAKLDFVLEKTEEYLEGAGLTKQKEALERLLSQNDTYNTNYAAKKGNIVMANIESSMDGYITLGAYSSMGFSYKFNSNSSETSDKFPYNGTIWGWDVDDSEFDGGITLNQEMLTYSWYELVNTLVHELTHATAYQYYPDPACEPADGGGYYIQYSYDQIESIREKLEADDLYDFYYDNLVDVINNEIPIPTGEHAGENSYDRLMYLLECQWGEYSAYQVDADYVDSIAGDIFNSEDNIWKNGEMTTAVAGGDEKSIIKNHIEKGYNTNGMTIEEYASAYGVDISKINDNDGDGVISYGDTVTSTNGEYSVYSRESEPDYEWGTYEKNKNWSWYV